MTQPSLMHDRSDNLPADELSPVRVRLARILESSDFPALSRQIIDTISTIDDSASSLQRLANVVLREYSLTVSVVRVANSVHYRRGARQIQSATHAMMMLGARTVRHLASSLLLFENYQRRSPALKELMILSLLTANHAREVAARTGSADPEEVHLCGMFRNLGEVLIACHFPDEYSKILELMQEKSEEAAATKVLGFRYEELGVEISRHWGMPDTVLQSMRGRGAATLSVTDAITAFSHDLTTVIYRNDHESGDAKSALDEVIARHAPRVRLSRSQVKEAVETALNETRELFVNAQVPVDSLRLRRLSEAARAALGLAAAGPETLETEIPAAVSIASPQLRKRLREELDSKADPASGSDVGDVLLLALEAALRGGPFERVMACVLSADRSRLVARSGLGNGAEELMASFDFHMAPSGGPVPAILLQRQPQYLPADRAMTGQETRWASGNGATQFGVFPLIVSNKIVGCLYADRPGADVPDRLTLQYVRSVASIVVKAIEARRRISDAATAAETGTPSGVTAAIPDDSPNVETRMALVLRLLQGESVEHVAAEGAVSTTQLEHWKRDFLEGARSRLAG